MPPEMNLDEAKISEIIQGIQARLSAPLVLSLAAAIEQPSVKAAIKEGIALSERCQEAWAEVEEVFEDLAAEVKAELAAKGKTEASFDTARSWVRAGESEAAIDIVRVLSTLNEQVGRATNGVADLRLLVPLGLGTLALRQILVKGLQIDEIPWYTLTWYAFDSFVKLNHTDTPPSIYPLPESPTEQAIADSGTV